MGCPPLPNRSVLVALLALCFAPVDLLGQVEVDPNGKFELTEGLSIGGDENAPIEYLFSGIDHIRTDKAGRIYVSEGRTEIRVYSREGEFLGALGRRGGGPGEFNQISAIAFDRKGERDRLVVYDRMRQQFTRFPPFEETDTFPPTDSDQLESFPNSEEYMINPAFMYGTPDGRFVLFYQPLTDHSLDQPRLHIYNNGLEKIEAFAPPEEWKLPEDEVTRHQMKFSPRVFDDSHFAPSQSSLLLAPHFYNGILHRYRPSQDGTWSLRVLKGRDPGHPSHDVLAHEIFPAGEVRQSLLPDRELGSYGVLKASLKNGRQMISAFISRSTSRGVGQLSDGRIVHLSVSEDENGIRQLQLEVFGPDGKLQDVGRIEGFVHSYTEREAATRATSVSLEWIDRRDRLYLVDCRSGFPVLRVMTLEE